MSSAAEPPRYREVARHTVELRWHSPRTWGERRLPHGGRFYAHAEFGSSLRNVWTYLEATGNIGPGGVETTELAVLTSIDDPIVPEILPGQSFRLLRGGIAAEGRVLHKVR